MTASLNSARAAQDLALGTMNLMQKRVGFAAFHSSGADLRDVGFIGATTDADRHATDLTSAAVGYLALDELAVTTNNMQIVESTVTGNVAQSVADATAGDAVIYIGFGTM